MDKSLQNNKKMPNSQIHHHQKKKILDEAKQHIRRVFIGQGAVHIDQEHQQNKSDKGLSEKIESSKRGHAHEGTILKDKYI
jgi:hypothetical protein